MRRSIAMHRSIGGGKPGLLGRLHILLVTTIAAARACMY